MVRGMRDSFLSFRFLRTPKRASHLRLWFSAMGLAALVALTAVAQTPPGPPRDAPSEAPPVEPRLATPPVVDPVPITSAMSLVHVGSNDTFAITQEGHQAAELLYKALTEGNAEAAKEAIGIYDIIIPRENYGGEYTALQWFARYLISPEEEKKGFLTDPFVKEFFRFYGDDDFAVLKEYLKRKYRVAVIGDEETKAGQERNIILEDTILFNNPRREEWEKTSELMKLLKLEKGQTIADVGSGPGYFSFRFSKLVGDTGRVYAIDMMGAHLSYIERVKNALGITNVEPINTDGTTLGLGDKQVDAVFLCSLYHNIYAMSTKPERDKFVDSIRKALKDDGTLYLVDNGLVEPGVLPYHGPYVAKELLIGQLTYYGYQLIEQHQYIPQRYLLVFKKGTRAVPLPAIGKPVAAKPSWEANSGLGFPP